MCASLSLSLFCCFVVVVVVVVVVVFLSFDGSETLIKIYNIGFALHQTNGFFHGYCGFPKLSMLSLSVPPSHRLSLSLICSISVLRHIIFITSHGLHVIVMPVPTTFQAPKKL